ncbi:MAG: SseB family protein [Streptosporangiaceae bacterium]
MQGLTVAEPKFPGDDGAAEPGVLAALTAYAAGQGSEHAALTALARSRLLVPVVAVPGDADDQGGEKSTEMALPTMVAQDGSRAILAFTCLGALQRWRSDARPVPVPAASAWLAGTQEADAVVIDVAGPVTLAVDGARLAALAAGRPVPLPHQDPEVLAALHAALEREPLIVAAAVTTPDQRVTAAGGAGPGHAVSSAGGAGPGHAVSSVPGAPGTPCGPDGPPEAGLPGPDVLDAAGLNDAGLDGPAGPSTGGTSPPAGADLALQVTIAAGCDAAAAGAAVRRAADALLAATGDRLRRGVEVSVVQGGRDAGRRD